MLSGRKTIRVGTIFVAVVLCSASLAGSQCVKIEAGGEPGAIGMLREVGGVLIEENGKLKFLVVMPSDQRLKAYQSVDLKQDDILLMFNGKRLKAVSDLTSAHETLEPGDEMKLGIKRGVDMRIVTLAKADPDDLPKMQMMTMTAGTDEEGAMVTTGTSADGEPLTLLAEIGLAVRDTEDAVVVTMVMPHAKDVLVSSPVFEGDRIISLQGKEVTSAEMLSELFNAINVGETVKLVIKRDGEQHAATFEKPKMQAQPQIMKIAK